MFKGKDIYEVSVALVPLYVAIILGYGSVRWWKIFTPDQCSGINRFVAVFVVPMLSFYFISSINPYDINFKFIVADSLQKVVILGALFLWNFFTKRGSLDWTITFFSLSTQPNTLLIGVPLLKAIYGEFTTSLMIQLVFLQLVIWYNFLLFLHEYRSVKHFISQKFLETAGSIISLKDDSNVGFLNAKEPIQTNVEMGQDGNLHMMVRSSTSSSMISSFHKSHSTPRVSNLTGVEIYSIQSSRQPMQRALSFNQMDIYTNNLQNASFEDEMLKMHKKRFWRSKSCNGKFFYGHLISSYPYLKSMLSGSIDGGQRKKDISVDKDSAPSIGLHMLVWSSGTSPASDVNIRHVVNRIGSTDLGTIHTSKPNDVPQETSASKVVHELIDMKACEDREHDFEDGIKSPLSECQKEENIKERIACERQQMPPTFVMTKLVLITVWRRLIRNPNIYAGILGLAWCLVSFRWNIKMPSIINGSIAILSNTGLGMAMFNLGLFMALQPKIIACGKTLATISMAIKFLVGPVVTAATSTAIGIHGVLLHVAIVQAAIPQGIVPFVLATEYNLHAEILSTAIIFGTAITMPITVLYYVFLGL